LLQTACNQAADTEQCLSYLKTVLYLSQAFRTASTMSLHIDPRRSLLGLSFSTSPNHPIPSSPRTLIFCPDFSPIHKQHSPQPIMCWMTDTYYAKCAHWGVPQVETLCAAGELCGLKSGCSNNTVFGTNCIQDLCSVCKYQASVIAAQVPAEAELETRESFQQIMQEQTTQKRKQAQERTREKAEKQKKMMQQKQICITHRKRGRVTVLTRRGVEEKSLTLAKQEQSGRRNAIMQLPVG
jgi:hypothetical protein